MPSIDPQRLHRAIGLILSFLFWGVLGRPTTLANEFDLAVVDHSTAYEQATIAATQAIVQLQGLPLSPPIIQGTAIVPWEADESLRLIRIEGQVQNQPETFLVDTGASTTLLSKALVQRLKLLGTKISGDRLSSAVAGNDCPNMDAKLHQVPSISIGSLRVQNLQGLEFLHSQLPYQLSGILGMNVLSSFDLKIYPKARKLALTPPSVLPLEARSHAIPLQRRLGVMLTQLTVNQKGPFTFLLDTGAATTFISPQVAQAAQLTNQSPRPVNIQGFCGLESAYRVMAPTIQLGRYQVQKVDTIVLDSSVIQSLQVDGILGQNVFNRFDQHWRFPNPQLPDTQAQGSLFLHYPATPPIP